MRKTILLEAMATFFLISCSSTTSLYIDSGVSEKDVAVIRSVTVKDKNGRVVVSPLFFGIVPLDQVARSGNRAPKSSTELDVKEIQVKGGMFRLLAVCVTDIYNGPRSFEGELKNGMTYEFSCIDDESDLERLVLYKKYESTKKQAL